MVLSLLVTATGTARFAVAMGYDANVGYAVGGVLTLPGFPFAAVIALWFAERASARPEFAAELKALGYSKEELRLDPLPRSTASSVASPQR